MALTFETAVYKLPNRVTVSHHNAEICAKNLFQVLCLPINISLLMVLLQDSVLIGLILEIKKPRPGVEMGCTGSHVCKPRVSICSLGHLGSQLRAGK